MKKVLIQRLHLIRINNGEEKFDGIIPLLNIAVGYGDSEEKVDVKLMPLFPDKMLADMKDILPELIVTLGGFRTVGLLPYYIPEGTFGHAIGDIERWENDLNYQVTDPVRTAYTLLGEAMMNIEDVEEYTRAGATLKATLISGKDTADRELLTGDDMESYLNMKESGLVDEIIIGFQIEAHYHVRLDHLFNNSNRRIISREHYYIVQLVDERFESEPVYFAALPFKEVPVVTTEFFSRAFRFPTEDNALTAMLEYVNSFRVDGFEIQKVDEPCILSIDKQDELKAYWI